MIITASILDDDGRLLELRKNIDFPEEKIFLVVKMYEGEETSLGVLVDPKDLVKALNHLNQGH